MSCTKTGALIYFRNYGMLVRGDVYVIQGVYIFRWNTESIMYTDDQSATHVVDIVEDSESWWHRPDIGVTVVSAYLVTDWCR